MVLSSFRDRMMLLKLEQDMIDFITDNGYVCVCVAIIFNANMIYCIYFNVLSKQDCHPLPSSSLSLSQSL